jgi:hypothetical protein
MLLPSVPLDELRRRVREAEASLRVAQQYARDAHDDPAAAEHASRRIQAICREVEALFPGMHEPLAPDPEVQEILASLQATTVPAGQSEVHESDPDEVTNEAGADASAFEDDAESEEATDDAGEETEGDEESDALGREADEWDIDYSKLALAVENETLMSRFPEPARTTFKRAAKYLIEANERRELFSRVVRGLEVVSSLAQRNADETRRKLELALTLERLASKRQA